jgi:uncharacterized damage-inducible protein DinB
VASRAEVEALLFLMDRAFEESRPHSLLQNLSAVSEADYVRADNGGRTIREMVRHVASAKQVYENQAFGDATLFIPALRERVFESSAGLAEDIEWLRHGHAALRASVAKLDDVDLAQERPVHMGGKLETRAIIAIMIEHDAYHAGEINHLRAVLQDTDYWRGREPRRD